jgi:hypothetical protein
MFMIGVVIGMRTRQCKKSNCCFDDQRFDGYIILNHINFQPTLCELHKKLVGVPCESL